MRWVLLGERATRDRHASKVSLQAVAESIKSRSAKSGRRRRPYSPTRNLPESMQLYVGTNDAG